MRSNLIFLNNLLMLLNLAYKNKFLFVKMNSSYFVYKILIFLRTYKFIWFFFFRGGKFFIFFNWKTSFKFFNKIFIQQYGGKLFYHSKFLVLNHAIYNTNFGMTLSENLQTGGQLFVKYA